MDSFGKYSFSFSASSKQRRDTLNRNDVADLIGDVLIAEAEIVEPGADPCRPWPKTSGFKTLMSGASLKRTVMQYRDWPMSCKKSFKIFIFPQRRIFSARRRLVFRFRALEEPKTRPVAASTTYGRAFWRDVSAPSPHARIASINPATPRIFITRFML